MTAASLAVAHITWRTGQVVPLVALLLGALVCGVTLLYLRQTSRTSWPWRVVLMTLRTIALTALALSLLKPTLSRDARPAERGAVLVVVDRSHSMSLHDRQRQPAQLVALADGLGLISSKLRSRGDEWTAAATDLTTALTDLTDAQSRLAFARISGLSTADAEAQVSSATGHFESLARGALDRPRPPKGTKLAQSLQTLRQVIDRPHGLDVAERWLPAFQSAVESVTEAAGTFQVDSDKDLYLNNPDVRAACDRLAGKSRLELVDEALTHEPSGLLYHLPAGGAVYGFAAGESIDPLPLSGPGGHPVRRLLTDANSSGTALAAAVREALDQMRGAAVRAVVLFSDGRSPRSQGAVAAVATPGVPVFAVSPAPFPGPHGQAIEDLSMAEQPLPIAVCAGETFAVRGRIYAVHVSAGRSRRVECLLDGALYATQTVPLQARNPTEVTFDVRIDAPGPHRLALRLPDATGEASSENNAAERWLKVLPARARVATWADTPTWDWRLANDALGSTPRFEVHSETATTLPSSVPDDLRALLLFGPDPHALTEGVVRALDAFVRDRGGLLVIVGSHDHAPSEYAASKALADLLPFAAETRASGNDWMTWFGDEPVYHFEPPEPRPDERLRWASLPPLYRFASLPPLKASAQAMLLERDTRSPVVARMAVGGGQVVFIGIDETWRWRNHDPAAAGRFWVDLVRQWAEPPYAVGDEAFALDVERAAVAPHEPFGVRAKLTGGPMALTVRVLGGAGGEEVRRDVLQRIGPGRYAATLDGLAAGSYQVEAISPDAGGRHRTLRYPLQVVPTYANEAEDPAASRSTLQRLADASGGRVLPMEDLRQLPALLDDTAEVRTVPVPLWDSTYLFVFVAACFCAEWALRKRLGLG